MLPVTTRTMGFESVINAYAARQYRENVPLPNLYSMYRVFLAAMEAKILKLQKESGITLRNPDAIYTHAGVRANFLEDIARYNTYPLAIKMAIDAVGIINDVTDIAYLHVIAAMRCDDEGNLQPRPENVVLPTLR